MIPNATSAQVEVCIYFTTALVLWKQQFPSQMGVPTEKCFITNVGVDLIEVTLQ